MPQRSPSTRIKNPKGAVLAEVMVVCAIVVGLGVGGYSTLHNFNLKQLLRSRLTPTIENPLKQLEIAMNLGKKFCVSYELESNSAPDDTILAKTYFMIDGDDECNSGPIQNYMEHRSQAEDAEVAIRVFQDTVEAASITITSTPTIVAVAENELVGINGDGNFPAGVNANDPKDGIEVFHKLTEDSNKAEGVATYSTTVAAPTPVTVVNKTKTTDKVGFLGAYRG